MNVPSIEEAKRFLTEAGTFNPGPWVDHSIFTAEAARNIASNHQELDSEIAYILGYLHDIGRRYGVSQMRHIIDGYNYLIEKGYDDCARICLTHSFPLKNIGSYSGNNDCNAEETEFIKRYISEVNYSKYDELIQLCDDGRITGYFSIVEVKEDFWAGKVLVMKGNWLEHLFILPELIGKRIGSKLISYAINMCREKSIGRLFILSDPNAKGFYDKKGARFIKESPSNIEGRNVLLYELVIC